jgi:hypothetical protein
MNPLRLALLLIAVLPAARADDAARTVLSQETGPGEWKPLVDALAGKGPIVASFTERRFFPFRREGTVLKGILRISPQRGLSLQYVSPDPSILIADASGLLMKDGSGRASEMPVGSRQSGAVSALLPIMRFDLPALYPRFVIRALHVGAGWRFELTPRDPTASETLGTITVDGEETTVRHLEFRRSSSQRVEIDVGDTRSGRPFSGEDLKAYFR